MDSYADAMVGSPGNGKHAGLLAIIQRGIRIVSQD
jgi:hypothetical protein